MIRDCEWVEGWRLCQSLASERRHPPNARQPLDVCDYHARLYDALQTVVQLYAERSGEDQGDDEGAR